ncbi:adenylate/guanylate cyclase domain-containing protein [Pacificispira sp.]|uniref:adenylate/guanylate cyclase domain-containing protein n=1 Tax=Pacificispira sp. TaxID=2888761 RepID=UPI003BA96BA3
MKSVKFVLGFGVCILIVLSVGTVGALGTFGSMESALEVTRRLQQNRTNAIAENLIEYFRQVEEDMRTLAELVGASNQSASDPYAIAVLSAFVRNKDYLYDLTLVRRDGSTVLVWQDGDDPPESDLTYRPDGETLAYVKAGRPGDGTEGFDDIFLNEDDRPVIEYSIHVADPQGAPIGSIFTELGVATISGHISDTDDQGGGYRFAFDETGYVLAHPTFAGLETFAKWEEVPSIGDLSDPVAEAVFALVDGGQTEIGEVTVAERRWLVSVAEVDRFGYKSWYTADVVPRDTVLGPAVERAQMIALVGLAILIGAVVFAVLVGRGIVGPIIRLSSAAKEVESLNIVPRDHKFSGFTELNRAEQAFAAMLGGLEVFARYVPKNLVRQLISMEASGRDVKATEREVTILFTDIASYTTISDGMSPNELAKMLNDYFEAVVLPVNDREGTVDKFIGDALMAFWNAPVEQSDHVDRALAAALEIQSVTARINAKREADGEPPLVTRIGIHTGTVLVGNIGASARMNYTIVGDAVNTTARLEALGKDVGETLCISSDTRDKARGDYVWREVGRVQLRGRGSETTVFTIDSEG